MNNRFNWIGRAWTRSMCALFLCGGLAACSDDYSWDDTKPGYLKKSIYEYLQNPPKEDGVTYQNFVRLIDDLNYAEVLAKTGSKTLFVADDAAFAEFYQNNPWGVKSYDELSLNQKKLILNSAMVNNAYLLEMMSSTPASGSTLNSRPNLGQCLRRETAATVLDSVPHFDGSDLPVTYSPDDTDYWTRFRSKGIRMALDNSAPMMTHFLATQMAENGITDEDFKIIVGRERSKKDAYIYDSKVIEQDIVCQNGYINRMDRVLLTPSNMAEMMRTNGETTIFSHMLDRFSVPIYSQSLTNSYRLLYGNDVDSVFEKRYFNYQDKDASKTKGVHELRNDAGTDPQNNPAGNAVSFGLLFDPGWNAYRSASDVEKEADMGVIFAPTDSRLYEYFFEQSGGGRFLLDAYAPEELAQVKGPDDKENIYRALDMIPIEKLAALMRNLMKTQFCNTVPSKFETVKDDAQDPMLDETHLDKIEKVLLANNGAIYLMDEVLTPAQYAAVSAPAFVSQDMAVMNYAIQDLKENGTKVNFNAYLLAMSSRFSFFTPRDGFWYIDPVSFTLGSDKRRAIFFEWDPSKSGDNRLRGTSYKLNYDYPSGTYTIDESSPLTTASGAANNTELYNRLNDILETHTVVHEDHSETTGIDETQTGIECNQHYFLAKNGAPIYVDNASSRENGMTVKGGWGIAHDEICTVTRFDDKTRETNGNGNGMAYQLDGPIIPTIESAYSIMYNNRDTYGKFFELCETNIEPILDALKNILNRDEEGAVLYKTDAEYYKRYQIFENRNGIPCFDKYDGSEVTKATNVRFFNNYRYTIYLPDDNAIDAAVAKGLPTWEEIMDLLKIEEVADGEFATTLDESELNAVAPKAAAMVTYLTNFLKYHFQDNSIFADTPALQSFDYETATVNNATGTYCKLTVSSQGNGTLSLTDHSGKTVNIDQNFKNQLARDYVIENKRIAASSFIVMHGLNDVLNFEPLTNGRYDSAWATSGAARRFIKKFQIKK